MNEDPQSSKVFFSRLWILRNQIVRGIPQTHSVLRAPKYTKWKVYDLNHDCITSNRIEVGFLAGTYVYNLLQQNVRYILSAKWFFYTTIRIDDYNILIVWIQQICYDDQSIKKTSVCRAVANTTTVPKIISQFVGLSTFVLGILFDDMLTYNLHDLGKNVDWIKSLFDVYSSKSFIKIKSDYIPKRRVDMIKSKEILILKRYKMHPSPLKRCNNILLLLHTAWKSKPKHDTSNENVLDVNF